MKFRAFTVHMHRAVTQPGLYACIVLQALIMQIMLSKDMVPTIDSALSLTVTTGQYLIMFLVLPAVAYSMTCTEDKNTRMLLFWSMRCGVDSYAVSYYLVTLLSGFATTFLGLLLGVGIAVARGYALALPPLSHTQYPFEMYAALVRNGHPFAYMLCIILDYAVVSMITAGVAAAAAALFRHKVTVLTAPMNLMYLSCFIFPHGHILRMNDLIGPYSSRPDLSYYIPSKLFPVVVYCVACGLVSVWHIKKEVRNG